MVFCLFAQSSKMIIYAVYKTVSEDLKAFQTSFKKSLHRYKKCWLIRQLHQSSNQSKHVLFYPLHVQFHFYSVAHSYLFQREKKRDDITFILQFSDAEGERKFGYIIQGHSESVADWQLIFTFPNFQLKAIAIQLFSLLHKLQMFIGWFLFL